MSTLVALLLAAAGQPPTVDGAYLLGNWVWAEPGEAPDFEQCTGPLSMRYLADGTYEMVGELGTWKLDRGRITETATKVDFAVWGNAAPRVGIAEINRVQRVDENRFRKRHRNGAVSVFHRCPAAKE